MTQNQVIQHPVCALLMPRNGNSTRKQQPIVCALLVPLHGQNALAVSGILSVTSE